MAKKFLVPIDLTKNELLNVKFQNIAGDHGTAVESMAWYDTTGNVLKYIDDVGIKTVATTVDVAGAGGGDMLAANNLSEVDPASARSNLNVDASGTINYTHPTGDGNLHVPATSTTNDGKVLTAGATAGVLTWETPVDTTYTVGDGGLTEINFTTALSDKLGNIEALADVTDTTNVTAAGALMDSEVDVNLKTFALPASTTISATGKTLVGGVDASAMRTTLGVDAAGADNSTDLSLAGTGTYISLVGATQVLTVDPITESDISDLGSYSVTGHGHTAANISDFTTAVNTAITNFIDVGADTNDALDTIGEIITRIQTNADALGGLAQRYSVNIGDNASTSIAVTHNFGTRDVIISVQDATTFETITCDETRTNTNVVTLGFAVAPTTDAYRVTILA